MRTGDRHGFQMIVLTPPGAIDPSLAIAACRAGELGVLELAYAGPEETVRKAIGDLAAYGRRGCGLKVSGRSPEFLSTLLPGLPEQIRTVIISGPFDDPVRQVRALKERKMTVLIEAISGDEACAGIEAGADGLIAKGNEAGGRIGEDSAFVLLQKILKSTSLPVWAYGGIGLHTAAACYAAGAAGVVLDCQLALVRESRIPEPVRNVIAKMDGGETLCIGSELGSLYRVFSRPGNSAVGELAGLEKILVQEGGTDGDALDRWTSEVAKRVGWSDPARDLLLLGQDACLAAVLARRFETAGGILTAIRQALPAHVESARASRPLAESSPLALSHKTRYPIVQGPMARISDTPEFLLHVAREGALPFFALGMSRASEIEERLSEAQRLLGDRPWGAGLLGFAGPELFDEHLRLVKKYRAPFALIAGGTADQVHALEQEGITAYLHVPSPGLLSLFWEQGIRRFIFEGRECGGHIGPRSSFVLWDQSIDMLLALPAGEKASRCHVLFAGGIHDALSAAMVAAMAAPLAEQGVNIGVQMGTAYLFTTEAVTSGAILQQYQTEALRCGRTAVLETAPGHASRCAVTPFVEQFRNAKRNLAAEGRKPEEIAQELERLNLGRLRMASKGLDRNPDFRKEAPTSRYVAISPGDQREKGMYMIGQIATLREETLSIKDLHADIAAGGTALLGKPALSRSAPSATGPSPCDIAVIGMSCLLPKAADISRYWENILNKVNSITEVPEERWDWRIYYDQDRDARDRVYSKWGGFLDPVPFDPLVYGMPPDVLKSIEPIQLLTLEAVRAALHDAGYGQREFPRERTSIILGSGASMSDLGQQYIVRSNLPGVIRTQPPGIAERLPEWSSDSFAGILPNVTAGRIANRFNLGGLNYTVDAACASSLAAVYNAVKELETGTSEMVIVGGADTFQSPFAYFCFSKTLALSPTGRCRTFDEGADGTCISEGIGVVVLKRLADARRDGDRIYAVIKGVGGSSDGKSKGITAPHPEGQVRAMRRAYDRAGFPSSSVGLIEAHGTGTSVGDAAEIDSLTSLFLSDGAAPQSCALGSVKSMIGHTKCAAGVAGLIKAVKALHHKILPPTIGIEKPRARLAKSPLYVNIEARPWIPGPATPRRAGVSGFGFGGTNFHVALEEYGDYCPGPGEAALQNWPSELFLFSGSPEEIAALTGSIAEALRKGAQPSLRDLSYTLWETCRKRSGSLLAVIASSREDLEEKLTRTCGQLRSGVARINDPAGIYFESKPLSGKVAFLFPGQGSQYPDMLRELALHFPEVRERFELADRTLREQYPSPLSSYIYPPPRFGKKEEEACRSSIARTDIAQPALGAANMGLYRLLTGLQVKPDMAAGHSYGEYAALCAAGVFSEETLYRISEARGRYIREEAGQDRGTMSAVEAQPELIAETIASVKNVWMSNLNSPSQTVISGSRDGVRKAEEKLREQGITTRPIAVSCAFHSPLVAPVREKLKTYLDGLQFSEPVLPVFSNTTAGVYPHEAGSLPSLLAEHLVSPVRFTEEIEAMYAAGARIFVEVGPRRVLTGLTRQILGGRGHIAISLDAPDRNGLVQLQHALGQLAAHAVPVRIDRLFEGRPARRLDLDRLDREEEIRRSPATVLVDGGRVMPLHKKQSTPPATVSPAGEASLTTPPDDHDSKRQEAAMDEREVNKHQVMIDHQRLMRQFLETEQRIMTAYLQESPRTADPLAALPPKKTLSQVRTRSFKNGNGEPLREERPPEPRSVTAAAPGKEQRCVEKGATAAAPSPAVNAELIQEELIRIVSERTGYPPDMLGLDIDLESDLGIDSIKRTEILGVVRKNYPGLMTGGNGALAEQLGRTKTLRGIMEAIAGPARSPEGTKAGEASGDGAETRQEPVSDKDRLRDDLIRIVSERTGYPPDMLGLDIDLESDLGVDSIKRTEILGVVRKNYPGLVNSGNGTSAEQLGRMKTLRGIIEALGGAGHVPAQEKDRKAAPTSSPDRESPERAGPGQDPAYDNEAKIPRFLLRAVEAPLAGRPLQIPAGAVFLITAPEQGDAADRIAAALREKGGRAALVRQGNGAEESGDGAYTANLCDPASVAEVMELVRRKQGRVSGILHLFPLASGRVSASPDLAAWQRAMTMNIKSLFFMAKSAAEDLRQSAGSGGGWLVAATLTESRAKGDVLNGLSPVQGGLAGIVKTVALEWPEVACKAVCVDEGISSDGLLECIIREMADRGGEPEVVYSGSRRFVLRTLPSAVDAGSSRLEIGPDWVLLVTGGARGITAEVALELARRCRPTLVLIGRSPLPQDEEAETKDLQAGPELKKVLIDRYRREGREPKLAGIESAYKNLLRDREIRANLEALNKTGATVRYLSADVRDENSFGGAIDRVYQEYGRIDGVIHGAGVIEDKLIEHKTNESFDRVFDTKADSAFILSRKLRQESLRFLVFFSSIAGRFGNRGQCDYAATNEVVNKLALHLDASGKCRIISANWGPWSRSAGMVTTGVQEQFARKGVLPISLPAGCGALLDEIRSGRKGEVEVIYGDGPWAAAPALLPLLQYAEPHRREDGSVEVIKTFDPGHDLFLRDHLLDGKAVVPVTFVMELMAETAQFGWPDRMAAEIRSLHIFKGIVVEGKNKRVRIIARAKDGDIEAEVTEPERPDIPLYRGTVLMTRPSFDAPAFSPDEFNNLPVFPMTVAEAYEQRLFHGPIFQHLTSITGMGANAICGVISPSTPVSCCDYGGAAHWVIDPVVLDCAFQLVLLWERGTHDMTGLPSRIKSFRSYGFQPRGPVRCCIRLGSSNDGQHVVADIHFLDGSGRLLGSMEQAEFTASKALNRLCAAGKTMVIHADAA